MIFPSEFFACQTIWSVLVTYVAGQTLILLHEAFILLVHAKNLADAVGSSLSLSHRPTDEFHEKPKAKIRNGNTWG